VICSSEVTYLLYCNRQNTDVIRTLYECFNETDILINCLNQSISFKQIKKVFVTKTVRLPLYGVPTGVTYMFFS